MADYGRVTAHVGTMGAGKTKKLVALYNRLTNEGKHVIVFKHYNDVQRGGSADSVVARNGDTAPATAITSLAEILLYETERLFDAILIDEIQFFTDESTIEVIEAAAMVGVEVHVFGLDVTSDFESFGLMGEILARADEVKKLRCKCGKCGAPSRVSAYFGHEKKEGEVKVGDLDEYIPLCRECYYAKADNVTKADVKRPIKAPAPLEEDKFYEFRLKGAGYGLELGVYESDLKKAGYTSKEVNDINSTTGVTNLLKDLGYM